MSSNKDHKPHTQTGLIPTAFWNTLNNFVAKSKKFTRSNFRIQICLFALILIGLSGCGYDDSPGFSGQLNIKQTWIDKNRTIDKQLTDEPNWIKNLTFVSVPTNQLAQFGQLKQNLILKITTPKIVDTQRDFILSLDSNRLNEVIYFNHAEQTGFSQPESITLSQALKTDNARRTYSNLGPTFNIQAAAINRTHYLLIKASNDQMIKLSLVDSPSFYGTNQRHSQYSNLIIGIILAMIIFNALLYFYTRKLHHILFVLTSTAVIYALMWQTGSIINWPWLAWPLLGNHSVLAFIIIADAISIIFIYHFMRLRISQSWWVKFLALCVIFRLGLLVGAVIQYQSMLEINHHLIINLLNISLIVSVLLAWVMLLFRTQMKFAQAKYIFVGWTLLLLTFLLQSYMYYVPTVEIIGFGHGSSHGIGFDLAIMSVVILWAFAVSIRNLATEEPTIETAHNYSTVKHTAQRKQLISQFQQEIQELVKDPTLSVVEVTEKINIKFHLLINRAFPIKNSMMHINEQLSAICTTGLKPLDIDLVDFQLNKILASDDNDQTSQFEISTSNNKTQRFLYMPLNPLEYEQTRLVFGLKKNQPIEPDLMAEFSEYCEAAYDSLIQAREVHQVAMAANLDALTGLYNLNSSEIIIKESLKNASRTTLACLSIEDLKHIKQHHGAATADQCVVEMTKLLQESLQGRAKLGRREENEFMAVFSDVSFELCEVLLEDFMQSVSTHPFSSEKIAIEIRIGMAESRINETQKSLIKKAQIALEHAKAKTETSDDNKHHSNNKSQPAHDSKLVIYQFSMEHTAE